MNSQSRIFRLLLVDIAGLSGALLLVHIAGLVALAPKLCFCFVAPFGLFPPFLLSFFAFSTLFFFPVGCKGGTGGPMESASGWLEPHTDLQSMHA